MKASGWRLVDEDQWMKASGLRQVDEGKWMKIVRSKGWKPQPLDFRDVRSGG
jgi:hypothetical protein